MIGNSTDVYNLARLPEAVEPKIHVVTGDESLKQLRGVREMVVFVDPKYPEKIMDHSFLGPILQKHADLIFVRKLDGKKVLRTDPVTIQIPIEENGVMGSVKLLHITTAGVLEGTERDDNYEIPISWRNAAARLKGILANIKDSGNDEIAIYVNKGMSDYVDAVKALARGLGNVRYDGELYKSPSSEAIGLMRQQIRDAVKNVLLVTESMAEAASASLLRNFKEGDSFSRMCALARFLAECPHNFLDCATFVQVLIQLVEEAQENLEKYGKTMEIEIYGPDEARASRARASGIPLSGSLDDLGLNGLKAVHKGSIGEVGPFMVRVKYRGAREGESKRIKIVLAKSVMQDDGGHCAKGAHAKDMQADMAAGASCAAILAGIAENCGNVNENIDFVFAIASNTADGTAYKVNDVIRLASGVTMQVHHTDAEGRIVLADVGGATVNLHKREGIATGDIISVATLTGFAVAVGGNRTVVIGENRFELRGIEDRGNAVGEPIQALQLDRTDYKRVGEKTMGDIRNLAPMQASGVYPSARGSQTAAAFIVKGMGLNEKERGRFTHFDIAPTLELSDLHPKDMKDWPMPIGSSYMETLYRKIVKPTDPEPIDPDELAD